MKHGGRTTGFSRCGLAGLTAAVTVPRVKILPTLAAIGLTACCACAADSKPALKLFADRLVAPLDLASIGGGQLLIADQVGRIHLADRDGKLAETRVLDLRDAALFVSGRFDERGLNGIAVHPKFAANRKFYAFYTAALRKSVPTNWNCTARLAEFTFKDGAATDERILLEIDMPYANHHGGRMAFGPDGLLYLGTGDGGNAHDVGIGHSPQGNGQDTTKLLGKILRIDVDRKDAGREYGIPKDNPFADGGKGAPEIFAWGMRNPWGLSFDRAGKRDLFVADVGQDSWEEINLVVKGGNYGWRIREGFVCFDPKAPRKPPEDCPKTGALGEPLLDPALAYKNMGKYAKDPEAKGISITGGYVYRGKLHPQLTGKYIFADWSRAWAKPDGVIYVASRGADGKWTMDALDLATHPGGVIGAYIPAIGEDADGELYVMTNDSNMMKGNTGKVYKLIAQ
jgi:glucose/arabinose dehydrogenase